MAATGNPDQPVRPGADGPRRIDDLLRNAARAVGTITFPDEREAFAEVDRRADDYAAMLVALGVAPGDRVALWQPPSLELVAATFGVSRAGAIVVPISDRFRAGELLHVLGVAEAAVLLTVGDDPFVDRIGILRKALPDLPAEVGEEVSIAALPELRHLRTTPPERAVEAPPDPGAAEEIAMLMFTSGTSAAPKACMLTHRALLAQAHRLAQDRYRLTTASVVWSPLPLFHVAGQVALMAGLAAAASFVHSGVFRKETTLPLLESERVTHALVGFETIWMQLVDAAEREGVDLSSIKLGLSTNGETQLRILHGRLPGVAFVGNYGSTEAGGHMAIGAIDEPEDIRLAGGGLPLPGAEVRIAAAETGALLPAGELGEIQFRGEYRFAGYFKDDAANAAAFLEGGWFRSGDLGTLDEAGRLYFRGRLKDMIKVGGENVAAPEVEAYLSGHPAIAVVAVVGARDDYYGEVPAAFVELAPGQGLSEAEVIEFCLDQIATFKVPRYVRFVTEWPMSGTKIKKDRLAERLAAELAAAGVTEAPRIRPRATR